LHVLHLSTAEETELFEPGSDAASKQITAEVCVHHLYFDESDYARKGAMIKWNPAIKSASDRQALIQALKDDRMDVIATDHAPHTLAEKANPYLSCPSGGPMVQHSLVVMMDMAIGGEFDPSFIVRKMCHAPADIFGIDRRGYIREGYYADLVILDPAGGQTVNREQLLYKCGWSPLEGQSFRPAVVKTFVNGRMVYDQGKVFDENRGMRLLFNR
jgi:dihydroorotase